MPRHSNRSTRHDPKRTAKRSNSIRWTLFRFRVAESPILRTAISRSATWVAPETVGEVDIVVFVTDPSGSIARDEDFCFYNQPAHPSGIVNLDLATLDQAAVDVHAGALPLDSRIILAAAIDGTGTFGELGAIELSVRSSDGSLLARATLDVAEDETSMLLAEVYWRNGDLRFRAVGQGYQRRLAGLAVSYGVDIEEDAVEA